MKPPHRSALAFMASIFGTVLLSSRCGWVGYYNGLRQLKLRTSVQLDSAAKVAAVVYEKY